MNTLENIPEEGTPLTLNDYKQKMIILRDKCLNYKNSHAYCKSFHFLCDKITKVSPLVLSSLTTYYITSHSSDEELSNEDLELDKRFTFATTFVSGINAIFTFSDKTETHKSLTSDYLKLYNELDHTINSLFEEEEESKSKELYDEFYNRFIALNGRTIDIGLMMYPKRKYNIS